VKKAPVKPFVRLVSFPQRLRKQNKDKQFSQFINMFKKLHINIHFAEVLAQMPKYEKFMKDIMRNKMKLEDHETVMLNEECNTILLYKLPPKLKDPRSFSISCVGNSHFEKSLCDLRASINLMPLYVFKKLGLGEINTNDNITSTGEQICQISTRID